MFINLIYPQVQVSFPIISVQLHLLICEIRSVISWSFTLAFCSYVLIFLCQLLAQTYFGRPIKQREIFVEDYSPHLRLPSCGVSFLDRNIYSISNSFSTLPLGLIEHKLGDKCIHSSPSWKPLAHTKLMNCYDAIFCILRDHCHFEGCM